MTYPMIMNGDHAEFEAEWAASGKPDDERPDWPLPSFDAQDWAKEFCRIANGFGFKDSEGKPIDEGWMIAWFANALMRGYYERSKERGSDQEDARPAPGVSFHPDSQPICALIDEEEKLSATTLS